MNKFNLGIYFTLVSRDVIKNYVANIETIFQKGRIETGDQSVSKLVTSNLDKIIGNDLFLIEVSDKILTLSFQIIIRVIQVAKDTINKKSMSAENLLRILDEITKIEQYLGHDFYDKLVEICSKHSQVGQEEISRNMIDSYNELYDIISLRFDALNQPCIAAASEKITQRLTENMQQFKQVAGVYRLTNKKAPTSPSEHTKVTFKPVENLVNKEFFVNLSPKLKTLLLNSIFQKSLLQLNGIIDKMLEEENNLLNNQI